MVTKWHATYFNMTKAREEKNENKNDEKDVVCYYGWHNGV